MKPENFANWLHQQGHKIYHSESSYWAELGPRVVQSIPYHQLIEPSHEELDTLLKKNNLIGLRYSAPIEYHFGVISYYVNYHDGIYDLDTLPSKARYEIRKGYKNCTVEQINWSQMKKDGWINRQETLIRQGRENAETFSWWSAMCDASAEIAGFDAWGAFDNSGKIIGSVIGCQCEGIYYILYQQSLTEDMSKGVNSALAHHITHTAMKKQDINELFYGLHSLDAPETVDKFKFRMDYEAKPIRQCIAFHPWISPLLTNSLSSSIVSLLSKQSNSATISKAKGMIRLHNIGKLPIDQQPIPEILSSNKIRLE